MMNVQEDKAPTIDPAISAKASRYAVRVFEEMSKRSEVLNKTSSVAQFDKTEVLPYVGDLLGRGGFNKVYELEKVKLIDNEGPTKIQRRQILVAKPKLAIKFLSQEALSTTDDACNGSADLLMEAKYLSAISTHHPHPNIIQIHGVSNAGPSGFSKGYMGYFILIDRLYDTLERRMDVWKELQRRKVQSMDDNTTRKYIIVLYIQRLLAAVDIASAIQHLHSINICFRDIKPDNIGFDFNNQVKLFDFGLAKELDPKQRKSSGLYEMSGGTGSRRFMSPEVALNEPYSLSADMYSYSILLWEMLSLEKAFGKLSVEDHRKLVIQGTERPKLFPEWNPNIHEILKSCWARDPKQRPPAGKIHRKVKEEVADILAKHFPKASKECSW